MLTVRQGQAAVPGELVYECINEDSQMVGRLTARSHTDGAMTVRPIETQQQEAARSLLAAFERDALGKRVPTIYLECRDEKEKGRYLPAGYSEMSSGGNILVKKMLLV